MMEQMMSSPDMPKGVVGCLCDSGCDPSALATLGSGGVDAMIAACTTR